MSKKINFKDLLFASQTIEEILDIAEFNEPPLKKAQYLYRKGQYSETVDFLNSIEQKYQNDPFYSMLLAQNLFDSEKNLEAIELLQKVILIPHYESRTKLWISNTLHLWGVNITADTVEGIVIVVPQNNGIDLLGIYTDGSVRYINYSGKMIIWDQKDPEISQQLEKILQLVQEINPSLELNERNEKLHPNHVQFNILTHAGIKSHSLPLNELEDRNNHLAKIFVKTTGLLHILVQRAITEER